MARSSFTESGLMFDFTPGWVVYKYDAHRFYLYLSGSGLKGVDFIAIKGEELFLIEIKNYRPRIEKEAYDPILSLQERPDYYVDRFSQKFKDTFRLLSIIDQYYHRKWWYRHLFLPFKSYFSSKKILSTEVGFWTQANALLQNPEQVKLVLWIEISEEQYALDFDYFEQAIQSQFSEKMIFQLTHHDKPLDGIKVTLL